MTSPAPITFSLETTLTELDRLSGELERMGEVWDLAPAVILQLNLALDELFTNVVDYGIEPGDRSQVDFTIQLRNNQLEIIICDEGKPFDPTISVDPDLTIPPMDKKIGGLGIFLVRQYTDSIDYRRDNGKNIITLTKTI